MGTDGCLFPGSPHTSSPLTTHPLSHKNSRQPDKQRIPKDSALLGEAAAERHLERPSGLPLSADASLHARVSRWRRGWRLCPVPQFCGVPRAPVRHFQALGSSLPCKVTFSLGRVWMPETFSPLSRAACPSLHHFSPSCGFGDPTDTLASSASSAHQTLSHFNAVLETTRSRAYLPPPPTPVLSGRGAHLKGSEIRMPPLAISRVCHVIGSLFLLSNAKKKRAS